MARTNLSSYTPWQFADYVLQRGLLSFVIGFMVGIPVSFSVNTLRTAGAPAGSIQANTNQFAGGAAGTLGVLLVLLAIQRAVSGDRTAEYYRFYFSKPVRAWVFYLQRYAAFGAGLLVMIGLLLLVGIFSGVPVHIGGAMLYFLILYLAMGGIGFLCSAATRYDWSVLGVVWFGAMLARTVFATSTRWPHWLVTVLPRAELMDNVRSALFNGNSPDTHDVAWLVGYGIVCLLLGLVVIQRRPLTS